MKPRWKPLVRAVAIVALATACPLPALAQGEKATVTGTIADRSTGNPVHDAIIALLRDTTRFVRSDSSGRYTFPNLEPGVTQLMVRADSFPTLGIVVELLAGQTLERPVRLDSTPSGRLAAAQSLPTVTVKADAPIENYRLVGFEQRRRTGRGQYLTEEQIVKSGAYNVGEAIRALRGVTYECGGSAEAGACHVRMSRAPMRCMPEWIIDEQVDNDFGASTPIRDVVAIEVYTGPSDVPGEYAGRNAGCGVIVLWTRSGPPRRRSPE
jgi:hypothetical protein